MAQIRAREKRERGRRDGNAGDAASDDSAGSSVEGSVDGGVESDGDLTARPHDSDSDDDDLADSDGDDGKRRMREVVLREKRTATRQKKFYRYLCICFGLVFVVRGRSSSCGLCWW